MFIAHLCVPEAKESQIDTHSDANIVAQPTALWKPASKAMFGILPQNTCELQGFRQKVKLLSPQIHYTLISSVTSQLVTIWNTGLLDHSLAGGPRHLGRGAKETKVVKKDKLCPPPVPICLLAPHQGALLVFPGFLRLL